MLCVHLIPASTRGTRREVTVSMLLEMQDVPSVVPLVPSVILHLCPVFQPKILVQSRLHFSACDTQIYEAANLAKLTRNRSFHKQQEGYKSL